MNIASEFKTITSSVVTVGITLHLLDLVWCCEASAWVCSEEESGRKYTSAILDNSCEKANF